MIPVGHAGFTIRLLVNGAVVETMQRTHRADAADRVTLSKTRDILVKQGDTITVDIVVEADPDGNKLTYQVLSNGSILNVERMPIF